MDEEVDQRIDAWHTIAKHPFFSDAYDEELPLIESMTKRLDALMAKPEIVTTQAEEPVEWRVLRAYTNGYSEGLRRGTEGGLDR
jgi:hypothetical protein